MIFDDGDQNNWTMTEKGRFQVQGGIRKTSYENLSSGALTGLRRSHRP